MRDAHGTDVELSARQRGSVELILTPADVPSDVNLRSEATVGVVVGARATRV